MVVIKISLDIRNWTKYREWFVMESFPVLNFRFVERNIKIWRRIDNRAHHVFSFIMSSIKPCTPCALAYRTVLINSFFELNKLFQTRFIRPPFYSSIQRGFIPS